MIAVLTNNAVPPLQGTGATFWSLKIKLVMRFWIGRVAAGEGWRSIVPRFTFVG